MKTTYSSLKEKHYNEFNSFPIAWAFNDKQFEEAKRKLGVTDNSELCSVYGGWLMKKTDIERLRVLTDTQAKELQEFLATPEWLKEALVYELWNYEFCYSRDYTEPLDALNLEYDTLTPEQLNTLNQAKKEYFQKLGDNY